MDVTILFGYVIAIAIPVFAVYLIFALDLFGTGKSTTVFLSLAWGAVGAFGLAYILNNAILNLMISIAGNTFVSGRTSLSLVTSFTGPVVEEILKAAVLVYLIQQPRFRYIVDGAIYGFAAGIGFSVAENLFYLHGYGSLGLVITRVLSASLMHATASGLVGISLGRVRRARSNQRFLLSTAGIVLAMVVHITYNNLVNPESVLNLLTGSGGLQGTTLLLVAIGFGFSGGVLIAYLINQGLVEEKKRFSDTLNLADKVSRGERKAVQGLGGDAIEQIFKELGEDFGADKVDKIRRLLVIQANIGILRNNLNSPASDRLRKAWEDEIAALRKETDQIRNELGVYVMSFLRGVFPSEDENLANSFRREIVKSDPTQVHSFDMFMSASRAAGTVSPEHLERMATLLQRIAIFKDVSLADLENLSRAITDRTYRDGEIIFKEGDEGDAMYLIEQGGINIFAVQADGKEKLLRSCQAGDFVGELALLDGLPRSASARASGSLRVQILLRDHFMRFIQSRPNVIIALLKFLAQRVRNSTIIIETSISWATHVAEGNYGEARGLAMLPTPAGATSPDQMSTQEVIAPVEVLVSQPDSARVISPETPLALSGAFARIAATLEQREETLRTKQMKDGTIPADISELPDREQKVMFAIMRNPLSTTEGILTETIKDQLEAIDQLPDILTMLTKNDWLITSGEPPAVRYKVNTKRKRGRSKLATS